MQGIEYDLTSPSLFRWDITFDEGKRVAGLVGLYPLDLLIPHESTTPQAVFRPRHPVQIRPVMALVAEPLPPLEALGPEIVFEGNHRHAVTPVRGDGFEPAAAVIADGHHRVAASLREGGDPTIMTMMVSSAGAGLDAGAFHRVFPQGSQLPEAIEGCTVVEESPQAAVAAGRIGVASAAGSIGIDTTPAASEFPAFLSGLPAGLASRIVLPALGLNEDDASYVGDLDAAIANAVAGTSVVLPPSRVEAVIAAARESFPLPPKATRFRPKPIRGFLMRRL